MKILVIMELEGTLVNKEKIENEIIDSFKSKEMKLKKLDTTIAILGNEFELLTNNTIFESPLKDL